VCLWRGGVYLPDFYLPKHNDGCYAEVKPDDFTEEEKKKCRMLCRMSEKMVLMLDSAPEPWWYPVYHYYDSHAVESTVVIGSEYLHTENRFFFDCGYADREEAEALFTEEAQKALFISRSYFS